MRAVVTMGVNVKDDPNSAIGFFGTGLKFAIAVLLRHKQKLTIYRGREPFHFETSTIDVRGKPFEFVTMNGLELGFTTELGKTWELWMAYRELYCNMLDEGGDVSEVLELANDRTTICVEGAAFEREHEARAQFVLLDKPDFVTDHGEVRLRPSRHIFYKGVRVGELPDSAMFTYNLTDSVSLTEDRTLKSVYELNWRVGGIVNQLPKTAPLEAFICAQQGTFERRLDFDWLTPSQDFIEVVASLMRHRRTDMNNSARTVAKRHRPSCAVSDHATLNPIEQQQLDLARNFCIAMGFPITDYPVICVERLGDGVLGLAADETIYLSRQAFSMGTKIVAGTIIEEFVHLREKLDDCSRPFQDYFINKLVSFGEEHVWKRPL